MTDACVVGNSLWAANVAGPHHYTRLYPLNQAEMYMPSAPQHEACREDA
jgi:hypothetical protein